MESRLFRLKTALRTVQYRAEGCFGNRNEIVNCFVSDRQFLLSASYHKPYQPSTAFYGNSGRQDENFLSPFSACSFTIFLGLFCASTVHTAKNLDLFRPSTTTISQEHPARKIIFSHRNILVIFPSIRKMQNASDKGDVLLFIIFYKL